MNYYYVMVDLDNKVIAAILLFIDGFLDQL